MNEHSVTPLGLPKLEKGAQQVLEGSQWGGGEPQEKSSVKGSKAESRASP